MQDLDAYESDTEWNEHVAVQFGEIARRPIMHEVDPDAPRLDMVVVLQQVFATWDDLRKDVASREDAAAQSGERD